MTLDINLQVEHLNTEFLHHVIECCLVKPHITPTSGNTQFGHNLWKSGYKYALRNYITQYVECFNELPSDVHRIESPPLTSSSDKRITNIVKFPNISPVISIKKGKAILLNKYPRQSDSSNFGTKGNEWGDAPTKYRSLRFLRAELYWPHQAPLTLMHNLQQHTKLSDEALFYLCRLVSSFLKVHLFPPNLVILRGLVTKLPKSHGHAKHARELVHIINQLDDESRARQVFQKVDYVVQPSYLVRYCDPRDGWHGRDNICLIAEKEKYEDIYKRAEREILEDVYVLKFTHRQQIFSSTDALNRTTE